MALASCLVSHVSAQRKTSTPSVTPSSISSTSVSPTPTVSPGYIDLGMTVSEAFKGKKASFNTNKNMKLCNKPLETILVNKTLTEYSAKINAALLTRSVRLGPGVFSISYTIKIPTNRCLIGSGIDKTTLKMSNLADFGEEDEGMVMGVDGENITLMDITLDGNPAGNFPTKGVNGFYCKNCSTTWCHDVRATGHSRHGFEIAGGTQQFSIHAYFEGCQAIGNAWAGFKLGYTAFASVYGSTAERNARSGIIITRGARTTLLRSNKLYNNECGISVHVEDGIYPVHTVLLSNTIVDAKHAGLCIRGAVDLEDHATFTSNYNDSFAVCYDLSDVRGFKLEDSICKVLSGKTFKQGPVVAMPAPTPSISVSPSATPSATPLIEWKAKIGCVDGIAEKDVCCESICDKCGGNLCKSDVSSDRCCPSMIKQNYKSCKVEVPPCVLDT